MSKESSLNLDESETDRNIIRDNSSIINNLSSSHENEEKNSSNGAELVHNPIPVTKPTADPSDQKPTKSNKWVFIVILLAVLVGVYIKYVPKEEHGVVANCSAFLNINQFSNQDEKLWKALKMGIEGTFNDNKPRPSVFALFSNDKDTMKSIMRQIVDITQKCTNSIGNPLNLSVTDLSSSEFQEDHTKLILKFKVELEKRKIMIINDIDKVPINVIPSLHSFCDTYNPLVAKSIIFFTIHVPEVPSGKILSYPSKIFKIINQFCNF